MASGRGVAEEVEGVAHERQRRLAGEPDGLVQRALLAVGELDALGEGEFLRAVLQVRRQLRHLAVIHDGLGAALHQQAAVMTPAGDPLEELQPAQREVGLLIFAVPIVLDHPLDELPVKRREKFLLVGGAGVQVNQVGQRLLLLARPGAEQVELRDERVQRGILRHRLRFADDA
jgi:hypothetical protein